jgi:hypothetical protein
MNNYKSEVINICWNAIDNINSDVKDKFLFGDVYNRDTWLSVIDIVKMKIYPGIDENIN